MTDARNQMGVLDSPDVGRHPFLRMRRILEKMTIFDDFLTTNDDFRRWSLPGRNGFREVVLFDIKGLSIVASAQGRVIEKRSESIGYGLF